MKSQKKEDKKVLYVVIIFILIASVLLVGWYIKQSSNSKFKENSNNGGLLIEGRNHNSNNIELEKRAQIEKILEEEARIYENLGDEEKKQRSENVENFLNDEFKKTESIEGESVMIDDKLSQMEGVLEQK